MAKWREVGRRIDALDEIGEILTAMRSLAFIEARRLADAVGCGHDTVAAIETAIADLTTHFAADLPSHEPESGVVIALGSERGLCGDLNDAVAEALAGEAMSPDDQLLAVGARLAQLLDERGIAHRALPGPAVAEDLPRALAGIVATIGEMMRGRGESQFGLRVVHLDDRGAALTRVILPLPALPDVTRWRSRPDTLLEPRQLYASLIDHYVFTALQVALRTSLLAENRKRLDQMGAALDRLKERLEALGRDRRRARQEAITEEIEVILLGALPVADPARVDRPNR